MTLCRLKRLPVVCAATLLLSAAGPAKSFLTVTPLPDFGTSVRAKTSNPPPTGDYTAAPTPNQDIGPPSPGKPSQDTSVAPGLFTPQNHTTGDGYLPTSSLQAATDSRARPGAGINLSMPLQ